MRYEPDGSNYHDHLCRCPDCNGDEPDLQESRTGGIIQQIKIFTSEGDSRIPLLREVQRLHNEWMSKERPSVLREHPTETTIVADGIIWYTYTVCVVYVKEVSK